MSYFGEYYADADNWAYDPDTGDDDDTPAGLPSDDYDEPA